MKNGLLMKKKKKRDPIIEPTDYDMCDSLKKGSNLMLNQLIVLKNIF